MFYILYICLNRIQHATLHTLFTKLSIKQTNKYAGKTSARDNFEVFKPKLPYGVNIFFIVLEN